MFDFETYLFSSLTFAADAISRNIYPQTKIQGKCTGAGTDTGIKNIHIESRISATKSYS